MCVCVVHAPVEIISQSTTFYFGQKSAQPAFQIACLTHAHTPVLDAKLPSVAHMPGCEESPNSDIFRLDFQTVSSLSSQLIYLANISSISFNLQKKSSNKSCFAVQYQTVTLNSLDFLGKNLAGVTKNQKTFKTAAVFLFVLPNKPWVSTTLAYKLSTLSSPAWNEHDLALGPTMQQCRIHSFWSCGFWSKPLGKPLLQLPFRGEVLQHDS